MTCDDYDVAIKDYLEHRLEPDRRRALERHMADCARCRAMHGIALEATCREVSELYEFLERTMSAAQRALFERHFTICPDCRNYLANYRAVVRASPEVRDEAPADPLPADFVDLLVSDARDRS